MWGPGNKEVHIYEHVALGLSGRVKVARAGVLLTVKKTSSEKTVIINDLPLLTYCELCLLVLVFTIADVCHRTQYCEQVDEGSERSKCFLPESYRNLLPFRLSTASRPYLA
jgi:hypothetical protein